MTHNLSLLDGQGPSTLDRRPSGRFDFSLCRMRPGLRLFRMRSLRRIKGLPWISALIAVDCPDLVHIQELPSAFVLKNCPGLKRLPKLQSGTLLHLEACAGLVSLDSLHSKEGFALDVNYLTFETVELRDCPKLRRLPENLEVNGRMILSGIGPITRWPDDLRVGSNLLIQNCPEIQELPALRIGGSLRIVGASNLRRLSPGTTVGLHLDLRACTQLESIPKGIRVGGSLLLPAHLQRFAPIEVPVAMTTIVGQVGTHA